MPQHSFIHLRNHTPYSLCKGAITISELVEKAKEYAMPAIAICDSSNLFGALEFSLYCKKNNIQPIIACEILIDLNSVDATANQNQSIAEKLLKKLVLIARNQQGYLNLMSLVSDSYINRKDGVSPHINLEELSSKKEGLIALSAGYEGVFGNLLEDEQSNACDALAQKFTALFPDNFYIELHRHNNAQEDALEQKFIDLAYKHNLPLVATNVNFFLTRDMHEAQDVLACIGEGRYVTEDNRKKLTEEHHFKSAAEMVDLFKDIPEAIENTVNIAKKCHVMAYERPPTLPHFQTKEGFSEAQQLSEDARNGLAARLEEKFELEDISKEEQERITKEYNERLDYELGIINQMNFSGYFLIVSDFIIWSKENDIPVGPGRGSGAGSIVAWALQITNLDPIRFGLLFERFLNPERVSMPDFDIDFCQARRDEVINYVQNKYGKDMVAQIITFGKLQARAALKDVGRVLQMPYNQVDRICKLIPFNAIEAVTLKKAIEMDKDLENAIEQDQQIAELVNIALKLEGLNRHASTHAAGIVIGDKPLHQICGLYLDDAKSTMPAVGYSMKYAEAAGLVKFDFLGLKTLTTISDTVKLVNKNRNLGLDIDKIRLDDQDTFDMLAQGDSIGAFQIESSGMQAVLRQMKPDKLEDIIALISLYRPGPMDNIPTYIKRKSGEEKITYPHPLLEPILEETYGVIVYQEQVMEIAKVLAGYSLGAADLLRRAMGKKIKEEMDQQREIFVTGAVKNNVPAQQAGDIFDLVAKFAGYGFNKSHAAAYALISYQTAYLKANFPVEFLTASINLEIDNSDKVGVFVQVAKDHGIKILPPDINKSEAYFTVEKA
ncbi:MAG: DNA polymerase III subunit alpha [Proteobacteria bacterium]|nr:DNA polymerase III subunit alpha [Pseudomonadota bacterium]